MMAPLENKDVAAEGFCCYPGGRPRYGRCSLLLSNASHKASACNCSLLGKTLMASGTLAAKQPGRKHCFAYSAQADRFWNAWSR